jgi:hypothetical protein
MSQRSSVRIPACPRFYTNIPKEAIAITVGRLQAMNVAFIGITATDIEQILHIIPDNTYFQYQEHTFTQIRGLAMGLRISGLLASIFVDGVEERRYVDDTFRLTKSLDTAKQYSTHLTLHKVHSG